LQKFPSVETVPHFQTKVIPGEPKHLWPDPWFDKLTTLSEVEGESRKLVENQTILDPDSHPALRDLVGMTNFDTVP
jgi:hypothetical protein